MAAVSLRGLTKDFGALRAVDSVDLDIADGELVSLLGPSGCGKTTTLRCVAGLEQPTAGEIEIGGELVAAPDRGVFVAPDKRATGMVFQTYALWPHMTVRKTVAYPLRMRRTPKAAVGERVAELLAIVGLSDRADRPATELSGGQQQRVALARAMANRPRLLLFDEPLSNLDAKLREAMRTEIRDLQARLGTTTLYVTHDQEEAMVLSDRIAVMHAGRIQQVGAPREIYARPVNRFVADFVGFENIVAGTVEEVAHDRFAVRPADGGPLLWMAGAPPQGTIDVAFRSSAVRVPGEGLQGTVHRAIYRGQCTELTLDVEGMRVVARLEGDARPPEEGERVPVGVAPEGIVVLGAGARTVSPAEVTA